MTPQEPSGRSLVWTATKRRHTEIAMHPIITRDLMKAWITDLHRQAKQSTPFTPAHMIAELTRRALTLLRFRRPTPAP